MSKQLITKCSLSCVIFSIVTCSVVLGQDRLPTNNKELAQRMASEREKIVSYRVFVVVKSETFSGQDFSVKSSEEETKFYFEFSRLENHFVHARRFYKGAGSPDWYVVGESDGVRFAGGDNKLGVSDQIEVKPIYFDPLVAGLHFCEMFQKYQSYEDSLLGLSRYHPVMSGVEREAEKVVWRVPSDGIRMLIDPKQGYWPISYEAHHVYKVESLKRKQEDKIDKVLAQVIKKVNGVFVPVETNMSCFSDGKVGRQVRSLTFDWKLINEPIATGVAAPTSVAETLGMIVTKIK